MIDRTTNKLFCLTTKAGGNVRKIVSCYFHAKQIKLGGCACSIRTILASRPCVYCEAEAVAHRKRNNH